MKSERSTPRKNHGAVIADGTAALLLLLPVLFLLLFVMLEASKAWCIQQALEHACREATRMLAEEYGKEGSYNQVTQTPPAIVTSRNSQNSVVFSNLLVQNIINSAAQFGGGAAVADPVWSIPGYNAAVGSNATVTVSCTYQGGLLPYGLPIFPDCDPLHLGNSFKLMGTATYHLENQ
jgi:Flp pilus assembly protein TadG